HAQTISDPKWQAFRWIGTTSLHTDDFVKEALVDPGDPTKGTIAEGFTGTDIDAAPDTVEYKKLRAAYNEAHGRPNHTELSVPFANAYDAAMLVALAIAQAGGVGSRERLRDALVAVADERAGDIAFGPTDYEGAILAIARGAPINYQGASGPLEFDPTGV